MEWDKDHRSGVEHNRSGITKRGNLNPKEKKGIISQEK